MNTTGRRLLCLLTLGVSFSLGTAWADLSILVSNSSFETLPLTGLPSGCGLGCSYSDTAIPSWSITNQTSFVGQFQPGSSSGNTSYFNFVPDGLTVAYSNGGTISQTVGAVVVPGEVYTMSVFLGNRSDCFPFCSVSTGTADLLINGTQYAAIGTQASPGNWTQWTATYTGLATDAGDPITIELNNGGGGGQGDFDDVSLSATPEPSFYGALGIGLAALSYALRRRTVGLTA